MLFLEALFWCSICMVLYVYAGYPFCVYLFGKCKAQEKITNSSHPLVSILIAAYNEEQSIGETINNKLQLDYPQDKLEIIVISDESSDQTEQIVQGFADPRVSLYRQAPRAGKTAALNMAVPVARGEILVFSDANSLYARDALKHLVANFADPAVGYVTGKMVYVSQDGTPIGDGCSAYMRYENKLREAENRLGSVVGVDGGIDAMRKHLYRPLRPDQLPDFVQPLSVVEKGFLVKYESQALLTEASLKTTPDEYRMRVRVGLRALWALWDMRALLWGRAGVLFAWQLWSHKLLRYFCFVFLLCAYVTSGLLALTNSLYTALFVVQTVGYTGGILNPQIRKGNQKFYPFYLIKYFFLLNAASGHAFINFIQRKKQIIWTPRVG
ncbi:MAG: glycosyl transferase [Deltaproteobacteria bacterium]|nr:MAG: glycosyl transferase [Deltaproteobacteria bacterium]